MKLLQSLMIVSKEHSIVEVNTLVWAAQENSTVVEHLLDRGATVVMVYVDQQVTVIAQRVCYLIFRNELCLEDGLSTVTVHQHDAAEWYQQHSIVVDRLCQMMVEVMDIVDLPMGHNVQHVKDWMNSEMIDMAKFGLVCNDTQDTFSPRNLVEFEKSYDYFTSSIKQDV